MAELAVGEVVDGRYRLEEVIGRGGMGVVFRARHVFTHQQVALKLITTDGLDPDTMSRFLAEARVAATIGHPAIVEVSDANRTPDGQLYLVMELLIGRPLRIAMTRGLTADDGKRIGLELLDAVAAAHVRGVIHRDLKPENIYLVAPTGALKVLDFGIAKMRDATHTSDRRILGTLEYMAPEQLADSGAVDARADLWAVAVILYELVTGVRPYFGLTREELFDALAGDREPTPISAVASVAPDVAAFFATALARDPVARFQTAHQMSAALRWLTLAQGVAKAPPGTYASGTGSPPGPTMGTGAAWIRPASHPPADEPRGRPNSSPPGPTLGTGAAWIQPASQPPPDGVAGTVRAHPGSIPPFDAWAPTVMQTPGLVETPAAPARASFRRRLALGLLAMFAIGAVIAIVVIGSSRTGEVARGGSGVTASPNARCTTACKKLEGCGLAQTTCMADCDRNFLKADCVDAASDCTQASSCIWQATCGRGTSGGATCAETLFCHQKCGLSNTTCLCECNAKMSSQASLVMGKLFTCHQNNPTNEKFAEHCMPLALDCQNDQPLFTSNPGPTPTPVVAPSSGSCEATCARLTTCQLAMPTCAYDCARGKLDLPCLNAATTCEDRERCYWKQLCGRSVKTGTMSCPQAMACWGTAVVKPISEQCSTCYDQMSPRAALDFTRYHACWHGLTQESATDPKFDAGKALIDRCAPLMTTCYRGKSTP